MSDMIEYTNNGFNIIGNYKEKQVLDKIKDIYKDKYVVNCEFDDD